MAQIPATPFHVMAKPRGAICNLDCEYCFFLPKEHLYPGSRFRMSDETLEEFIRQYLVSQLTAEVTFTWQGGEPLLMGLDFFKKALQLQQKYVRPGQKIVNTLQTNATLVNEEWAAFFKANQFLLGVSLDGPAALHDTYRVDKGGAATHARVMNGLSLLKRHAVEFNILCCVSAANAGRALDVYRFFRDEVGAQFIQFIPIVHRNNAQGFQEGAALHPHSVSAQAYGQFLTDIFDEWVRRDVGRVFVQIFDVALAAWMGLPPGLCIFESTCGQAVALEHTGDVYACDHYVEPDYRLGNIFERDLNELVFSPRQIHFGKSKADLPAYCLQCSVRFICNGGCPKDRILQTPAGESGLNYLCAGYKAFFSHIDPAMQIMVSLLRQQRPPAQIMQLPPATLNLSRP